jgi:hypothetical protein
MEFMEILNYSIDSKKRNPLSKGSRIQNCLTGALFLYIGIRHFDFESLSIFTTIIILFGIYSIIYGLIGKELLMIHYYLIMDSSQIKFKRSFNKEVVIKLNSITYLKFIPSGFEITCTDYVKTYDLSWLKVDEFEMLKSKLQIYCKLNNIMIE